jgi:hypothetical protein
VKVEITDTVNLGRGRRLIWYRYQDDALVWHSYGPVNAASDFDPQSLVDVIPVKIERQKVLDAARAQKDSVIKGALDAVKPQLDAIDAAAKTEADTKKVAAEAVKP